MTNGSDPIGLAISPLSGITKHEGLTKREHFAATQNIPWSQAAVQVEQNLGHQGTILEVAEYLAEMKVIAADALINALNKKP